MYQWKLKKEVFMVFKRFFLFFFLTLAILSCSRNEATVLHDVNGNSINLSQQKGKWIVINYWAEWCDNCLKEIPELNKFYQNTKDKNIIFIGVNFDRLSDDALMEAINKTNIQFPVIKEDPSLIWNLSEVEVLPMTFIINPQGKVVREIPGTNTQESLLGIINDLQG